MSASKTLAQSSQLVIVDTAETAGLPKKIRDSYRSGGIALPIVIFADPGLVNIFGRYDYTTMKPQEYPRIFQATTTSIKTAKEDGSFSLGDFAPQLLKVTDPQLASWKSSRGSEIRAKLIGIEDNETFIFERPDGSQIRATSKQLDPESVAKGRKLVGAE